MLFSMYKKTAIIVETVFSELCKVHFKFSLSTNWVIRGTWQTIQQRSSSSLPCRRSLSVNISWARMSTQCQESHTINQELFFVIQPTCVGRYLSFQGSNSQICVKALLTYLNLGHSVGMSITDWGDWNTNLPLHVT